MSPPVLPGFDAEQLRRAAAEIEDHVRQSGWDQRPALFALVSSRQFAADEPETASRLGVEAGDDDTIVPIEQDDLPEGELDEVLGRIVWPDSVAGCAIVQEIVILPPSAESELAADLAVENAVTHPDRRDARLVVAVLRSGTAAAVLRLRAVTGAEDAGEPDDLLTGPDLAPNLVSALLATFED